MQRPLLVVIYPLSTLTLLVINGTSTNTSLSHNIASGRMDVGLPITSPPSCHLVSPRLTGVSYRGLIRGGVILSTGIKDRQDFCVRASLPVPSDLRKLSYAANFTRGTGKYADVH